MNVQNYRIVAKIHGTTGSDLYRVRDPATGAELLLKRIDPDQAGADQIHRFKREYRLLASLTLPGVAKPVALIDEPGCLDMLLENFAGQSLETTMARGSPPDLSTALAASTPMAPDIVGASASFNAILHKIHRVTPTNATVLLLGESGVGKSRFAREVHKSSKRSQSSFIEVNCAAIPEKLIESELFGVERGGFLEPSKPEPDASRSPTAEPCFSTKSQR